jgi:hypothetical protein
VSQDRLPPPEPEACLVRLRPSSQKGGTIIAEDVTDLGTHERRLCDPDGYRPVFCPSCLETRLHVHDYRERVLRAEPGRPVIDIVRHECVSCEAIWQVLPIFLARNLWRTWSVVERVMRGASPAQAEAEGTAMAAGAGAHAATMACAVAASRPVSRRGAGLLR